MTNESFTQRTLFGVISFGIIVAFITSVMSHYATSHRLAVDVLMIGLIPYVLYGILSQYIQGYKLLVIGVLVLSLDIVIKLPAWVVMAHDELPSTLYLTPIISSIVILVAIVVFETRRQFD